MRHRRPGEDQRLRLHLHRRHDRGRRDDLGGHDLHQRPLPAGDAPPTCPSCARPTPTSTRSPTIVRAGTTDRRPGHDRARPRARPLLDGRHGRRRHASPSPTSTSSPASPARTDRRRRAGAASRSLRAVDGVAARPRRASRAPSCGLRYGIADQRRHRAGPAGLMARWARHRRRRARADARPPAVAARATTSPLIEACPEPGGLAARVAASATSPGTGTTTSPCCPTSDTQRMLAGRRPRRRAAVGRDQDRLLRHRRRAALGVRHRRVPAACPALNLARQAPPRRHHLVRARRSATASGWSASPSTSGCAGGPASARSSASGCPLLRAKLGDAYQAASAAFIWATIQRLYAARRSGLKKEMFGYVPGGVRPHRSTASAAR